MASAKEAIAAAQARLSTARFGLEDMRTRPERVESGMMNAVVFGRQVTFALQNMRGTVAEFDDWYASKQTQMRTDPLLSFFHNLRTEIEKRVESHTSSYSAVHSFSDATWKKLQPAPPGAVSFFIGDPYGRSGWEVLQPDGSIDSYFVDLPPVVGFSYSTFRKAPQPFDDSPTDMLIEKYLVFMEELILEAESKFCV